MDMETRSETIGQDFSFEVTCFPNNSGKISDEMTMKVFFLQEFSRPDSSNVQRVESVTSSESDDDVILYRDSPLHDGDAMITPPSSFVGSNEYTQQFKFPVSSK